MHTTLQAIAGTAALAVALVVGIVHGIATAQPARITEDDPRWDCRVMGDRQCGPDNTQGVTAGCYNDTGALIAPWPCVVTGGRTYTMDGWWAQ